MTQGFSTLCLHKIGGASDLSWHKQKVSENYLSLLLFVEEWPLEPNTGGDLYNFNEMQET